MSADTILQHLKRVRQTKPSNWIACCPAHDDKSPSLSICELDDGRVLAHCFAGCSINEIMSSVGLDMSDLYPPREDGKHFSKSERRPFPASDILRAIAAETLIVYLAAVAVAKGQILPEFEINRLLTAASRIQAALTAGGLSND